MADDSPVPSRRLEGDAWPTKSEILAHLHSVRLAVAEGRAEAGLLTKREIARALGIKGDGRIALKLILRELEAEGAFERRPRATAALPPMIVVDITGRDRDGDLFGTPSDWEGEGDASPPRVLIHVPKVKRAGAPLPGVGDRALVRLDAGSARDEAAASYTGRVVKLLARKQPRVLALLRVDHDGARAQAIDKRNAALEFVVPEAERHGAQNGDLIAIEPLGRAGRFAPQAVRVVERLGPMDSEGAVSMLAILAHGIPHAFRPETLAEAAAVAPAALDGFEDWRDLPLVTIDPPDAKDHDDAVHASPDEAPDNVGGFVVTVAIADVARLVRPGSAMDREALERGNSVYFPDRVVPMLPERISTDLGSLRPGEDRPALALRLSLGRDGRKKRHSFHRVMIRSAAKLSYAQAQAAIDGEPDATTGRLLEPVLEPLWAAFQLARAARDQRAPLELDLPERKIVLKPDGRVDRVLVPERLDAHRLIEEFMILANVAAAETLEARRQSLVYRVHDEPSLAKLNALQEFLATIGVKLAKGQVMRPAQFNGILARVKGTEHEHLVNEVVLRSQAQAEYAVENYGHFGLNLPRYAHFTSPIRRYADLIVHRALIRALGLGSDGLPDIEPKALAETAARISAAERRAMAAERETIDRLISAHLADQVGASFQARISGVTRSGLFVRLAGTGADGFVPAAMLGDEYFSYDEARHAMVGTRTRTIFQLGQTVDVRLVEAAPLAGALRFEIIGSSRAKTGKPGQDRGSGRGMSAGPRAKRGKRSP